MGCITPVQINPGPPSSHIYSQVQTFEAPTFFMVHAVNAFEDRATGELHVDMPIFDGPDLINDLYLDCIKTYPGKELCR